MDETAVTPVRLPSFAFRAFLLRVGPADIHSAPTGTERRAKHPGHLGVLNGYRNR